MPMDKKRYPKNWPDISLSIRARANWRCEWCGAADFEPHPATGSRVVLTVHHLGVNRPDGSAGNPHDKMDCRPENLVALCQKCHLGAEHQIKRNDKRAIQEASGQRRMFDDV